MGKLKVHELRTKNKGDLAKQLEELKTELAALRVAKVTGGAASKPPKCAPRHRAAPPSPRPPRGRAGLRGGLARPFRGARPRAPG